MSGQLLVLSKVPADRSLAQAVAGDAHLHVTEGESVDQIVTHLIDHPKSLVLWDVDRPLKELRPEAQAIAAHTSPGQVFVLSSKEFRSHKILMDRLYYGHYLCRRDLDSFQVEILRRVFVTSLKSDRFGLQEYVETQTKIHRIEISHTQHRRAAVEAVLSLLSRSSLPGRLATRAAQAVDELLLHGIFEVPRESSGFRYRAAKRRDAEFELATREFLDLELAESETYYAIGVSDRFGSFDRATLVEAFRSDLKTDGVTVNPDLKPQASLGMKLIWDLGLSLLFIGEEGRKAQTVVVIPKIENQRELKRKFQFFGFFFS